MSNAFLRSVAMLACKLFLDSDGVIADFDTRCQEIFGEIPTKKDGEFWEDFMGDGGFAELPRMPFSEELEPLIRLPEARILTGTPREPYDAWAADQKREWYSRHFGLAPEKVTTCLSYQKPRYAAKAVEEGFIPILIDDREESRDGWEAAGGIFIHYPRPNSSVDVVAVMQALDDLSRFAAFWRTIWGGSYLKEGAAHYKERLWKKVTEDEYRLARALGRDSYGLWPAVRGVNTLLSKCAGEAVQDAEERDKEVLLEKATLLS